MEVNEQALIELLNHAYLKMKADLVVALEQNEALKKEILKWQEKSQSSADSNGKNKKTKSATSSAKGAVKE